MATPFAVDIATLLKAFRDKLISDNVFLSTNCFLSLVPSTLMFPPNDQFATLQPLRQTVDSGSVRGGGRVDMYMEGQLGVTVWSRLALDQLTRDDSYLTDSSLGALGKLACVINSLQLYQPVDSSLNQEMCEPLQLITIESPKLIETSQVHWGSISTIWQMNWWVSLACTQTN